MLAATGPPVLAAPHSAVWATSGPSLPAQCPPPQSFNSMPVLLQQQQRHVLASQQPCTGCSSKSRKGAPLHLASASDVKQFFLCLFLYIFFYFFSISVSISSLCLCPTSNRPEHALHMSFELKLGHVTAAALHAAATSWQGGCTLGGFSLGAY